MNEQIKHKFKRGEGEKLAAGQITWEQFVTCNNDARGVRYKFEDLSRQLFTYEFLSQNKKHKYVHSNPNNPGIESEPILDEENDRYIGYQAKFFDKDADYNQIKESAEKAVKHYKGRLDVIYLFCNKALTTTCDGYKDIEKMLSDANIVLQPITDTTILDLVRKYPFLGKYYFDDHNISHEWFVNRASITVDILGERFNAEFNVDTEASRDLSIFLQDRYALDYYNGKKRNLIEEVASLRWKFDDMYKYARKLSEFVISIPDVNSESICDVEKWQEMISTAFENDINEIEAKLADAQNEYEKIKNRDKNKETRLKIYIEKLKHLKELFYWLVLPEIERNLLNKKFLVVEGKAGMGKTQLFANETISLLDANEDALLIIGSDCLSDINIFEQLKNNLRLNLDFEELIDILDVIGEINGKIVPILIDALNESWKPQLWKSVLPILYKKVSEKNNVRLAISFRSEYQDVILPERFLESDNVVQIEHRGFRDNLFEASKQFLAYYGIPFTPLHMFTADIYNPLFLTLYCKTYQGDEAELPVLYERILKNANNKVHMNLKKAIESAGYDETENLVFPVIEAISKMTLSSGRRHFEKSEIESLEIWTTLGLAPRSFITQLLRENILHDYESGGKTYVYFSFDQMNDYFSAKTILSMLQTEEEIKKYVHEHVLDIANGEVRNWGGKDLFVHVCALYATKFRKECIDIIDVIDDESDRMDLFRAYIESFEWRSEIYLNISELLELCNRYFIEPAVLWNSFINNSVKQNHLLNADNLYKVLKQYSVSKRDYLWTIFINGKTTDDDRIAQLIEIYNKGEVLEVSDKEQIRLLLILFSWVLTSSNRWLRDTTSKAMIEILKNHFEYTEYLLNLFSDVNDPYIIQRLLARISDYYPMKNRFSMEEERVLYDGPWEPYVKDFDPTLNEHNLSCDDAPYFQQVDNHIKKSIQEKNYVKDDMTFDEDKWVKSSSIFWKYQKDDLLLTDDAGNQWIVLSKYADTGREDLAFDKLLIWNWLYGYFVTDQQLTILKEYANKKVNLINSDIAEIPESYTLYNREYPWSSGSKSVLDWQWKTMELETGETKLVESIVEEPQFSWVDALLKAYSGEEGDVKAEQESEKKIDEFNIPTVTKTYKREEPVTIKLERILNATQDLLWEEEFDASKEEVLSYSYPCAEIINTLKLRQNKYDGYYYDVNNELIAFDTDLTNQKAGLIIRKDALDKFLKLKKFHLVWFVNASKEIHDESRRITKFKDWTGLLEYTGDSIQGEYYIVES